jgi:hypothetical protein
MTLVAKDEWVAREAKVTWRVALGSPKGFLTTETAHHSRFKSCSMVEHLHFKEKAVGSIPTFYQQKAKSVSVVCEKHLILEPQGNQVWRNSQGEISSCKGFRKGLAPLNGSQDRRDWKRGIAYNVKSTAWLKTAMLQVDRDTCRETRLCGYRKKADSQGWLIMSEVLVGCM